MTSFWSNWLKAWVWVVGLFGAVLTLGAFEATAAPVAAIYGLVGGTAPVADPAFRFTLALLGAVTVGWALTLAVALDAAHALGGSMWRGLTIAVLCWYLIDSALSVATGFPLNAVSNTVFLAGFLLPMWRSGFLSPGGKGLTARSERRARPSTGSG